MFAYLHCFVLGLYCPSLSLSFRIFMNTSWRCSRGPLLRCYELREDEREIEGWLLFHLRCIGISATTCSSTRQYRREPEGFWRILQQYHNTIQYRTRSEHVFAASCAQDGHFKHGSDFAFGGSDGHGYWKLDGKEWHTRCIKEGDVLVPIPRTVRRNLG